MAAPTTDLGSGPGSRVFGRALGLGLALLWVGALLSPAVSALMPLPLAPLLGAAGVFVGLNLDRLWARLPGGEALLGLADADPFAGRRWIGALALYLAVRAPLLIDPSYGADPDAWRLVSTGNALWREGVYQASRLPGYPVPELLLSPFVAFAGPQLTKLAVAAVGFGALLGFDRLGRALGARPMGLATLILAMAPTFIVQSASAMDYVFALGALLAAALAVAQGRVFAGAGWMGVAFASRVTSALYGAPLVIWARARGAQWKSVAQLALFGAQAGAVLFIPVMARYQLGFLEASGAAPSLEGASAAALGATGLPVLLALGVALGDQLRPSPSPVALMDRRFLAASAALGLLVFALLPLQAGYLLPALTLLLLLGAATLRPQALVILGLAGLLSLGVDAFPGSVRGEVATRAAMLDAGADVRAAVVKPGSVVLLGSSTATVMDVLYDDLVPFEAAGPWKRILHDPATDVRYVGHMSERLFEAARDEGRTVYVWSPAVEEWTLATYGYSPLGEGAVMLHGKTSADRARKQVESWVVRPKEAASQVKAKGERVEIRALEQGVVRACLSPNTPVDAARVAKGEVALSGEGERPGFKLVVLWLDEQGEKVGTSTLANARQGALTDEINTPLTPPAGAVEAQLCASVEGAGLTATLTNLELTR